MPDQNSPTVQVVGLSGSLRDGRYARLAVQIARRGAAELGATPPPHHALNSLRMVGRALHAWVIPEQASVAEAHRAFDAEGRPRDTRTEGALLEGGRQVARFAFLHSSAQVQEFLRLWEKAPFTPGARDDM